MSVLRYKKHEKHIDKKRIFEKDKSKKIVMQALKNRPHKDEDKHLIDNENNHIPLTKHLRQIIIKK